MMIQKKGKKRSWNRAAVSGFCIWMSAITTMQSIAGVTGGLESVATWSNAQANMNTASDANARLRASVTGDLWVNWTGDLSFLDGTRGDGTQAHPYQIATKEQLMGLSELAANDMVIEDGEGTKPGDYSGKYFILTRNLDLNGMEWMPIGFYQSEAEMYFGESGAFRGHFDGNGKAISNFKIHNEEWRDVGLFGTVVDSEIHNLTVKPGYVVASGDNAGLLGGKVQNSRIYDVQVSGALRTTGNAGGIAGELSDGSVVENCVADHVAIDSGDEKEVFVGGIAGKAAESLIADCTVNTGDSYTARIQGGGHVGGIVGFQNDTDIFNVHVMGTIGGNGSQSIGGVTGKYASGKLKVARFEGTIANSGLGSLAREGTFIGTHDTGFYFRYGTESGTDVAYLFADSEEDILAGVCGSGIPDDNQFEYGAHIGFWHKHDNFFTLMQGQNGKAETEKYFYEELENGVLHVTDTEVHARDGVYDPDHFAPNEVGKPERGYLISVLQIDTATAVEDYYDVAALTARGRSVYSKELDREHRGAVAAGDVVTVVTAPKNTESEKYQMEGRPTYTNAAGMRTEMEYQSGGFYTFVMPEHDTEISAVYKKVAAEVQILPEEYEFHVVQTRKGDRKSPSITTEVKDRAGKLLAKYLNHELAEGTSVQEVTFDAVVETNNDVADRRVQWSVDDSDLFLLKKNADEDSEGYTALSASIELNLRSEFFRNIIETAEREQREHHYRYAISDTIYGAGVKGGIGILTAMTRPAASFEGKPAAANCKIPVTFQMKDHTYVASEGVTLNKSALEFVVTRTLTGNRKSPKEVITVTEPQTLTATFFPEYCDKKEVIWRAGDDDVITVSGENRDASVVVNENAKWIKDIIWSDLERAKADNRVKQEGTGSRETVVTVQCEDMLGNRKAAECPVTIRIEKKDQTYLHSSGGSGSSSGGSSSGGGSSFGGNAGSSDQKTDCVTGNWMKTEDGGWMFATEKKQYKNEWAFIYNPYAGEGQSCTDWFFFDERGYMVTGWRWIPASDGLWRCYYLNPVSDGTKGRLLMNEMTPDGYQVDESGAWVVDGVVQTRTYLQAAGQ